MKSDKAPARQCNQNRGASSNRRMAPGLRRLVRHDQTTILFGESAGGEHTNNKTMFFQMSGRSSSCLMGKQVNRSTSYVPFHSLWLLGWSVSLVGWRPSLVGWRPFLLDWRPLPSALWGPGRERLDQDFSPVQPVRGPSRLSRVALKFS